MPFSESESVENLPVLPSPLLPYPSTSLLKSDVGGGWSHGSASWKSLEWGRPDGQTGRALLHKSEMLSCPSAPARSQNDPRDSYGPLNVILAIKNLFCCFCYSVAKSYLTLWPHSLQHARLPCPPPSPGVSSDLCPLSWWCYLSISSSAAPFSFGSISVVLELGIQQWAKQSSGCPAGHILVGKIRSQQAGRDFKQNWMS